MSDPREELKRMADAARNRGAHPSSNVPLWCEQEIGHLSDRLQRAEELLAESRKLTTNEVDDPNEIAIRIDAFLGGHHDD